MDINYTVIAMVLLLVAGLVVGGLVFSTHKTIEVPVSVEKVVEREVPVENPINIENERNIAELTKELGLLRQQLEEKEKVEESESLLLSNSEVIDNLFLGDVVNFDIDSGEIASLWNDEITFDDEQYDTKERIRLESSNAYIDYSAIGDEELGDAVALSLDDRKILSYSYEFRDEINMSDVSDKEALKITFLGAPLDIVKLSSNELTIRSGDEYYLEEGESIVIDGKDVVLNMVSDNDKVSVCVDKVCDTIEEFETSNIGGLDIRAEDVLVNRRTGSATLVVSNNDALRTIKDGDEWVDGDDEWILKIESAGDNIRSLNIYLDETRDDIDEGKNSLLSLGEELCFPGGKYCLKLSDVLHGDYETIGVRFKDFNDELYNGTDVKEQCVLLDSSNRDTFSVADEDVDELYVCQNEQAYYQDSGNDWFAADLTDVTISNEDYDVTVYIGGSQRLNFVTAAGETVRIDTKWAEETLGTEKDEAEATDVRYNVGSTWEDIGTREYDFMGTSGLVVEDVESNADNDEVSLRLPSDILEAEVVVYATE